MKIDIDIEPQLEQIWKLVGLTGQEIEDEYSGIQQKVVELFSGILDGAHSEMASLRAQVEAAEREVQDLIARFDLATEYQPSSSASLKRRLAAANERRKELEDMTAEQGAEYEAMYSDLVRCYEALEIEDRGEFASIGRNYSLPQLTKMHATIAPLMEDLRKRRQSMEVLVENLNELRTSLSYEPVPLPSTFSDRVFKEIEETKAQLQKEYDSKVLEFETTKRHIHQLERAMRIPHQSYTELSDLPSMKDRVATLEDEKARRIPEVIAGYREILKELLEALHMPLPSMTEFPFYYSKRVDMRTLIALESECMRYQTLKESVQPIIDLLEDRDDLLMEGESARSELKNPSRLTSRKSGTSTFLLNEERRQRKISTKLPKIDSQLRKLLTDYQRTYGERFMWNGEDVLSTVQSSLQHTKKSAVKERLSTTHRRAPVLEDRAPFQLQSFMV